MTKKKVIRNFCRKNGNFFFKKRHSEILGPSKKFSAPPNSAPGLRHCNKAVGDPVLLHVVLLINNCVRRNYCASFFFSLFRQVGADDEVFFSKWLHFFCL